VGVVAESGQVAGALWAMVATGRVEGVQLMLAVVTGGAGGPVMTSLQAGNRLAMVVLMVHGWPGLSTTFGGGGLLGGGLLGGGRLGGGVGGEGKVPPAGAKVIPCEYSKSGVMMPVCGRRQRAVMPGGKG
jgi:hypothetical protein